MFRRIRGIVSNGISAVNALFAPRTRTLSKTS
jgi:hypothetical protein